MSTLLVPHFRDRLMQLTDALHQLKERVREAVASEMGRIISDSVRELLTTALRGRNEQQVPEREYHSSSTHSWHDPDEEDHWDHDPGPTYRAPSPIVPPTTWPTALTIGVLTTKWLWLRRFAIWSSLGIGSTVGLLAMHGHPIVQTLITAVSTAAELIPSSGINAS